VERLNVGYLSCEEVNIRRNDQECRVYKEKGMIGEISEKGEKMRVKVTRAKVRKIRREVNRKIEQEKKRKKKRNTEEGKERRDRLEE